MLAKLVLAVTLCLAAVSAQDNGPPCDATQGLFFVTKLPGVVTGTQSVNQCRTDSTYYYLDPRARPTTEQTKLMCTSAACRKIIEAIIVAKAPDCVFTILNNSYNVYREVTGFNKTCDELLPPTTAPAPTTIAPVPTTTAPAPTTTAPAPTTTAPAPTTTAPAPTTTAPAPTTTAPAPTTTAPAPTTTAPPPNAC